MGQFSMQGMVVIGSDFGANQQSVFILGADFTKTGTERVVMLNAVVRRVIESRRGMHKERVFTYRSKPLGKLHSSA